jgi:hypothetical protein
MRHGSSFLGSCDTANDKHRDTPTDRRPRFRRGSRRDQRAGKPGNHSRAAAIAAVIALAGLGTSSTAPSAQARTDVAQARTDVPQARPDVAPAGTDVAPVAPGLTADSAERAVARSLASRDYTRTAPEPASPPPEPTPLAPLFSAPPTPTKPTPVAGLDQSQMDNAVAIVEAGRQMNLPRRAFVVAIAAALQESNLRVLANPAVPASMKRPNQGVGYDHDSIGLFQQRPAWGTVDQLMDPRESARRFYAELVTISGWEKLTVTVAAQRVQRSAFPNAYAKHQKRAEQIVDSVP